VVVVVEEVVIVSTVETVPVEEVSKVEVDGGGV